MNFTEWTVWTAAIVTDSKIRDDLIDTVHLRAGDTALKGLFPFSYDTNIGERRGGEATSALGAMFAPMALYLPAQLEVGSGPRRIEDDTISGTSKAGAITGGVIGGIAAFISILLVIFFWRRRLQKTKEEEEETKPNSFPAPEYPEGNPSPRSNPGFTDYAPTIPSAQVYPTQRSNGKRTRDNLPEQPQYAASQPTSSLSNSTPSPVLINNGDFDIRNEFERLRRDMEAMRLAGVDVVHEPPPQYQAL
jgi:hypothetical protein